MLQLLHTMFITNNHNSFHLRWNENLVKYQNIMPTIVGLNLGVWPTADKNFYFWSTIEKMRAFAVLMRNIYSHMTIKVQI